MLKETVARVRRRPTSLDEMWKTDKTALEEHRGCKARTLAQDGKVAALESHANWKQVERFRDLQIQEN